MSFAKSHLTIVLYFFTLLFINTQLFASDADSLNSKNSNTNHETYSFTVGYWNDNFLFDKEINNLLNNHIFQTNDDFITTSFWLRISKQKPLSRWILDSYLNITTNKQSNFRTDLLSLILSYETNLKFGLVRFGSGIIFSGNFGGIDIQNFYHNMASIDNIDIPYSNENYFGLAVNSLIKPKIFHKNNFQLNGVTSISLFSGGGPNSIELGLESNYNVIDNQLLFNVHLGYNNYFNLNRNFKPFFGKGIVWGIFSTIRICNGIQSSFWITGNQYGTGSQNHFGISFSFLTDKLMPLVFEDEKYP